MNYTETSESLKDSGDFRNVYRFGKSAANRTLVLYVYKRAERMKSLDRRRTPGSWKSAGEEKNRVGISVSKKVGNSVVRHHLCRLVRESYRLHDKEFVRGLDMIVIVRPGARELTFSEFERALLHVSRRAGVLKKEEGAEKSE